MARPNRAAAPCSRWKPLVVSWRDLAAAKAYETAAALPEGARLRRVRIIRDYGMFDRRETPQYYPDVQRRG